MRREDLDRHRGGRGAWAAPALAALVLLAAPAARAQEPARTRPRLSAAVGMGICLDDTGLATTEAVPAFFATGGVGADWPVGAELAAFASSPQGRYDGTPVDRLSLAAIGVLRPFAWTYAVGDTRYGARVLRASGLELGLGLERDGTTARAGSRYGLHLGARVELPIPLPGYDGSELHLRFAARRLEGFYTPVIQTMQVGDSLELYAALVSVF